MSEVVLPAAPSSAPTAAPINRSDLDFVLRQFVADHLDGWTHAEWQELLERARVRGNELRDEVEIGRMLERYRVLMLLQQVRGVGQKRRQSIADHFPDIWRLRQAGVDGLVESARIPRRLAEQIQERISGT
jgi:hypothetical protein